MENSLQKLLNISKVQGLLDSLNGVLALPTAVVDAEGSVLAAAGWCEICVRFDLPATSDCDCLETFRRVGVSPGRTVAHTDALFSSHGNGDFPPPGLLPLDVTTPIAVNGRHLGSIFTGQFFLAPPDLDFFTEQAQRFGFEPQRYLAAVRQLPVVSAGRLRKDLAVIENLATSFAEQALQNIRLAEANGALKRGAKRHGNILHTALSGICVMDAHGRLLEVNEAYCRQTGYSEEELLQMSIGDLECRESPTETAARIAQVMADGQGHFETMHRRKDGSYFEVEVSVQYQPENEEFVAFVQDVSQRKRAELFRAMGQRILLVLNEELDQKESLKQVLALIRVFSGVDAVGIRLQDADDYPYFYQEGFPQEFLQKEASLLARAKDGGICRDEWGNVCLECTCGLVISEKLDILNPLFTVGGSAWTNDSLPFLDTPPEEDSRLNPRDECIHQGYASVALIPIRAKGRVVGLLQLNDRRKGCFSLEIVETLEDVAKNVGEAMLRKQAEEKLIASERFLRTLTDQLPGMVGYWNAELRCEFANRAYLEWFGKTPEQMLGMHVRELAGDDFFEASEPYLRRVLEGIPQQVERALKKPSGELGYSWVQYIPDTVDGSTRGFLVLGSDITALKKAQEEKASLESQLQQAQKMESIGRLAGGVAHDFNNMLAVIIGHAETLLMEMKPDDRMYGSLTEISKAGERSAELTRQLLAFARKQEVSPKVLDLNHAVKGMLSMLKRLIGENVQLGWQPGAALWPVRVDSSQIDQIMANLCVNARDAIADVGAIRIETANVGVVREEHAGRGYLPAGDYVRISVSDTGAGMTAEVREHIFEPFYTTKGLGEGTGLGLATVYGIVRQNDGYLEVESEPEAGTTFSIYLPRHRGDTEGDAQAAQQEVPGGQETVLLVEDEKMILDITAMILERLGYYVLKCGSSREALDLAAGYRGPIHLILTDVVMPEMNGAELAQKVLEIHPRAKLLVMSGYTADIIASHGVAAGEVNFIQKPFNMKTLSEKLREVLEDEGRERN